MHKLPLLTSNFACLQEHDAQLLRLGMTVEEILVDYEDLEQADIFAALVFATRLSQVKRMQPLTV